MATGNQLEPPTSIINEWGWTWIKWLANVHIYIGANKGGALQLHPYSVADVPDAGKEGQMIYIIDEVGGATPAFSDGNNWLRTSDRAVIS